MAKRLGWVLVVFLALVPVYLMSPIAVIHVAALHSLPQRGTSSLPASVQAHSKRVEPEPDSEARYAQGERRLVLALVIPALSILGLFVTGIVLVVRRENRAPTVPSSPTNSRSLPISLASRRGRGTLRVVPRRRVPGQG